MDDVEEIFTTGIGGVDDVVVVLIKLEQYLQKLWRMMMMDIYNSRRGLRRVRTCYLVSLEKSLPYGLDPLHPSQPLGSLVILWSSVMAHTLLLASTLLPGPTW